MASNACDFQAQVTQADALLKQKVASEGKQIELWLERLRATAPHLDLDCIHEHSAKCSF